MSYMLSVSGHVGSKKAEAEVLAAAVGFAEQLHAEGSFSFAGTHFKVATGATDVATAEARTALAEYNLGADDDDQVTLPSPAGEAEA
jgi:hypothetical protein